MLCSSPSLSSRPPRPKLHFSSLRPRLQGAVATVEDHILLLDIVCDRDVDDHRLRLFTSPTVPGLCALGKCPVVASGANRSMSRLIGLSPAPWIGYPSRVRSRRKGRMRTLEPLLTALAPSAPSDATAAECRWAALACGCTARRSGAWRLSGGPASGSTTCGGAKESRIAAE